MLTSWVSTTLGDCAEFLSGGTPSKSRSDYWGGTIPWVSAKDMKRFQLDDTEDHLTNDGVQNGTKLVPGRTVLLLTRGMTLLNDVPICVVRRPMTFNQDVKAVQAKAHLDQEFLPYLLLGHKERLLSLVDLAGHGTGRLNTPELKALEIVLPPITEQREIARLLAALDQKIDVNQRMNVALEGMARAVFKSWFLDFAPVQARMEGRDPGLPAQIAGLFPDRLVESDIGEIPQGWRPKPLAECADLNPESWTGGARPPVIQYVDLSATKWGRIDSIDVYQREAAPSRAQRILRPGDTIVGTVRPGNGSYALILREGLTGSTGFAVLRARRESARAFVYLSATSPGNIERLAHLADGAAYPAVLPQAVLLTEVAFPTDEVMTRFADCVDPLLAKIGQNEEESRILAAVRDELLPKLISGEIRLDVGREAVGA